MQQTIGTITDVTVCGDRITKVWKMKTRKRVKTQNWACGYKGSKKKIKVNLTALQRELISDFLANCYFPKMSFTVLSPTTKKDLDPCLEWHLHCLEPCLF